LLLKRLPGFGQWNKAFKVRGTAMKALQTLTTLVLLANTLPVDAQSGQTGITYPNTGQSQGSAGSTSPQTTNGSAYSNSKTTQTPNGYGYQTQGRGGVGYRPHARAGNASPSAGTQTPQGYRYAQPNPGYSSAQQAAQTRSGYSSAQQGVQTYGSSGTAASTKTSAAAPATSASARSNSPQSRQAASKAYDFSDSISSGGTTRTYKVHLPPGYDRSKPIPLVMIFHGIGGTGSLMWHLTQFNVAADKKHFAVVYPDGLNHRWDDGAHVNSGDLNFISDMIAKLSTQIKVDRRRVYSVGYSNGGHFTMYLACQTNLLAGMAIIGSSMIEASAGGCSSSRIPAIFFLGTSDPIVPSNDQDHNATLGKLGDALGIGSLGSLSVPMAKMGGMMTGEETIEFWARHNGNSPTPYTTQMPDVDPHDGTTVSRNVYGSSSGEIDYYRILNGGHTWPNAIYNGPSDVVGLVTHDIDATDLIADFFAKH
jgi:polyhydroxybutyrate depolymerase